MTRAFATLCAIGSTLAAPAIAAPVSFDQVCHFSGPSLHADLNGESIAFDLTGCSGQSPLTATRRLVFELRATGTAAAREQGARQLNLLTQYAFHRAIEDETVHLKLENGEGLVDGTSLVIELPVQANGLDLLPTP